MLHVKDFIRERATGRPLLPGAMGSALFLARILNVPAAVTQERCELAPPVRTRS